MDEILFAHAPSTMLRIVPRCRGEPAEAFSRCVFLAPEPCRCHGLTYALCSVSDLRQTWNRAVGAGSASQIRRRHARVARMERSEIRGGDSIRSHAAIPGLRCADPIQPTNKKGSGTPKDAKHPPHLAVGGAAPTSAYPRAGEGDGRGQQRVQRDAPPLGISAAALAAASQQRGSELPGQRFPGTRRRSSGGLPPTGAGPGHSDAPRMTGHSAGRACCPKPPGSDGDEPPPAGTALAPSSRQSAGGVLCTGEIRDFNVSGTVTAVKLNVTEIETRWSSLT